MLQDVTIQEAYSTAYYYTREKLWRSLVNLCKEGDRRFGDPFFVFWKAYGIFREGNPSQAVTEIQKIESKKELQWASIRAAIFYHRQCKNVDHATVDSLEYMERDFQKNPTERAVVAAIYFDIFNNNMEEARRVVTSTHFDSPIMLVARGWYEVLAKEDEAMEASRKYFDEALKVDQRNVEAYFGIARLGEKIKKYQLCQNAVDDILEINPDFVPGLIEKCRLGIFKKDFGYIKEGFQELLRIDKSNIMGHVYWVFYLLASEGSLDEAREKYEKLYQMIMAQEPDNPELMLFVSRLMSRICGRATIIINISIRLIERCRQLDAMSILPILELADCMYMIEDYTQAFSMYKMAASLNSDVADLRPMLGIIKTQMAQGEIQEAAMQLQFLKEMAEGDGGKTPELSLVEGMLLSRRKVDKKNLESFEKTLQESNKVLDECIKLHLGLQKKQSQNLEYYIVLNPDFLLTLANEMLHHSDFNLTQITEQIQNPITPTHLIRKSVKLLETTISKIPGLIPGYMLAAKANLIIGNVNGAIQMLQKAIQLDPKNEEAYILNAIVVYANGNAQSAYVSIKEVEYI